MKQMVRAVFIVLTVLLIAPASGHAATVDVTVSDFRFSPATVTINAGDTVRWNFLSGPHTTTSGSDCNADGLWNSGFLGGGDAYEQTFDDAGSFPYFCAVGAHCASFGMKGSVIVAAPSGLPVPTGAVVIAQDAVVMPGLSSDPQAAAPIGFGPAAQGGTDLNLRVGFAGFASAMDVYVGIFSAVLGNDVFILKETGELLPLSAAGIVPWKRIQSTGFTQSLFGDIPVALLPDGTYTILVAISPPGSGFSVFTLWQVDLTVLAGVPTG